MIIYVLLAICVLILALFFYTKEYDSVNGIILVILVASVITMRAVFLKDMLSLIYVPSAIINSFIYTSTITIFSVILLYFLRKHKNTKRLFLLFFLYLIAGFVQQLLFQYVFLETVYFLIPDAVTAVLFACIYYSLFHYKEGGWRFVAFTFMINIFWSLIYLNYGNLIPLAVSHGILGTAYYTWHYKGDIVKGRSKLFTRLLKN